MNVRVLRDEPESPFTTPRITTDNKRGPRNILAFARAGQGRGTDEEGVGNTEDKKGRMSLYPDADARGRRKK